MVSRGVRYRVWLVCLSACVFVSPARGADTAGLAARIDKLISDRTYAKMRLGVRIELIHPERELVYKHGSDRSLKPASNQKLLTTAATLSLLSPDFAYRTLLARRGEDLVVIGSGDPSIGDPRMAKERNETITALFDAWADRVASLGVKRISGDLLFDDYVFEQMHLLPNWREQFNSSHWYVAPIGGLNFNDNCVDVVIAPASKRGQPARITLIPDTPWVKLANKTRTAAKGEPVIHRTGTGPITIAVSGRVSKPNSRDKPQSIAVTDPGMFFGSTFQSVLAKHDIEVVGELRRARVRPETGVLPRDVKIIATHERKLTDVLWRVNKSSQNAFAEALLKTLGAYTGREQTPGLGSYETGRAAIVRFLEDEGIPSAGCVIDDGSGLSHHNRLTANVITAILARMDRHPRRKVWWSNLAVPGEAAGTLRRRMKDLADVLRAKTGHIGGVSTLSGYVIGPGGRRYAFSVLCNDTHKPKGGTGAAHKLQEAVCRTLATWNPEDDRAGK